MKITRRVALDKDYEFYELVEECELRKAPSIIATIEEIVGIIREGAPHTLEQAEKMVSESEPKEIDMSLIQFAKDGQSATTTKFVDKETWTALNNEMKRRGFKWVSAGKESRWEKA